MARAPVDMWAEWGKATLQASFLRPVFWPTLERRAAGRGGALAPLRQRTSPSSRRSSATAPGSSGATSRLADIEVGLPLYRYFTIDLDGAATVRRSPPTMPASASARPTPSTSWSPTTCSRPPSSEWRRTTSSSAPGSAGSALAYRLGEAGHSVLVIEYGGSDWGPFIQMPAALSYPMNMARYDWGFRDRARAPPRRPAAGDAARQGAGRLLLDQRHGLCARPSARLRPLGRDGRRRLGLGRRRALLHPHGELARRPLRLARQRRPAARDPRAAAQPALPQPSSRPGAQAGFELTYDYNGEKQEGFGPMEQTVWKGRRWSAANAYLRPALTGRQRRASSRGLADPRRDRGGPRHRGRGEPSRHVADGRARREVILAASSINTPKLLMLSGIGPAAHLAEHGIAVVADRPGVGANLQDHLELYIQMRSLKPVTLYSHYNYDRRWLRIGLQVAARQGRARHLEPVRERGLRPLRRRGRVSRHPVPLPAARGALRRQVGGARPRLPGACGADALALARARCG